MRGTKHENSKRRGWLAKNSQSSSPKQQPKLPFVQPPKDGYRSALLWHLRGDDRSLTSEVNRDPVDRDRRQGQEEAVCLLVQLQRLLAKVEGDDRGQQSLPLRGVRQPVQRHVGERLLMRQRQHKVLHQPPVVGVVERQLLVVEDDLVQLLRIESAEVVQPVRRVGEVVLRPQGSVNEMTHVEPTPLMVVCRSSYEASYPTFSRIAGS